ncbi:MAG: D-ribose ABC transporter substrate-binding protein [Anaerolineae bacterium]|nr:D-ribose ABC transporter substrate-binding protein [Anaerolineae bacterium]
MNLAAKRRWNAIGARALVLVAVALLTGCAPGVSTAEPTAPPKITVGVLLCMTEDTPFFVSLVEGAREAASRHQVTLVIEYAGDDAAVQSRQIQSLVARGVNALLVNPVSDTVAPDMEAAAQAGIPVMTIDRSAPTDATICHIASDNRAGGSMAGEHLAEVLGRQGNVVELMGTPGSSAARDRGAGFHQALAAYPDIQVIAQETGNFRRVDGKSAFAHILAAHPDIDGVFAHNDDMILGAIEAAEEAGRASDIVFVGFDAIEEAIAALEEGKLLATVAQRPAEMGRLGVETAVRYLRGEPISPFIPVDLALITR